MKLEQVILKEDLIEEGITFFKNSIKLKKLSQTILNKTQRVQEKEKKDLINSLVNKIELLSNKFERLEQEYLYSKNKKEIKNKYKEVEKEFTELLQLANKEQTKNILKQVGIYGIMVASMIIPYKFINNLTDKFGEVGENGVKTLNPFVKAGVFFSTSTALNLLHPNKLIDKKMNPDVVEKSFKAIEGKNI